MPQKGGAKGDRQECNQTVKQRKGYQKVTEKESE